MFPRRWGPGISERFSSRGAAFGDYDNDGDIDALILNMNDLPSLLRNDGGNQQNWIKIKLIGTKCNRTAIGARVRVITGKHTQMDEVHSGSSVMSQSDLRLHFGLGKARIGRCHRSQMADYAKDRTLHPGESQSDPHYPRRRRHRRHGKKQSQIDTQRRKPDIGTNNCHPVSNDVCPSEGICFGRTGSLTLSGFDLAAFRFSRKGLAMLTIGPRETRASGCDGSSRVL